MQIWMETSDENQGKRNENAKKKRQDMSNTRALRISMDSFFSFGMSTCISTVTFLK